MHQIVKELQALLEPKVQQDHRVTLELLVHREPLVLPERRVHKVQRVHKALQELREPLVLQELRVHKAQSALMVSTVGIQTAMAFLMKEKIQMAMVY